MCRIAVAFAARIYIFRKDVDVNEGSEHNLDFYFCWIRHQGRLKEEFAYICNKDWNFVTWYNTLVTRLSVMHLNFNEILMNTII